MAMDSGVYFSNVIITLLIAITFFILVLVFLYVIFGKEETKETKETKTTAPKTKTKLTFGQLPPH